jgi:hypothetical protein
MRLYKNPDWNDQQRERNFQRRIDELYDRNSIKWGNTGARTLKQKITDIIEDLKPEDEATNVIIYSVANRDLSGEDYPIPIVPENDGEKWDQHEKLKKLSSVKSDITHDDRLAYIATIGIKRINSKSSDEEIHYFNAKNKRADQQMVAEWSEVREKDNNTRKETIQTVKANSVMSEQERLRLKREEVARRKRKGAQ